MYFKAWKTLVWCTTIPNTYTSLYLSYTIIQMKEFRSTERNFSKIRVCIRGRGESKTAEPVKEPSVSFIHLWLYKKYIKNIVWIIYE